MMKTSLVLVVFLAISNIIRGMTTVKSKVGFNTILNWTIQHRTEDMLYINHNNKTIARLWPEKSYYKPNPEYINRLEFSFVRQDLELRLNVSLKNISNLDKGLYTCHKLDRNEEINTVKLIVIEPFEEPQIKDISRQQTHSFENKIVLLCQLSKDSNHSVFWRKNESLIKTDKKYITFNNTLTIVNVEETDQYDKFSCADDMDTIRSKSYGIRIDGPDNITFMYDETTIHECSTSNITCVAECHLSCSFQWIKHGNQDIPETLISDMATMQVTNASRKDAGTYSCMAKNTVTNKTAADSIVLKVIYGPDSITFIPNEATVHEFGSLDITCLADCYIPCSFQWIKHGDQHIPQKLISDLATMQIPNATRKDAGNYSCTAKNTVSNKSVVDRITLEVIYQNGTINNSPVDIELPDEGSALSDAIWTPILTNILPGIAVILTCLICGFLVYKSRKRCCKQNTNITGADVGPPHADIGNRMVLELIHTEIDPHANYWTIDEDSTGGLRTILDKTGASESPSLDSRSCHIKKTIPLEKLEEICLQSDENAYIHPI